MAQNNDMLYTFTGIPTGQVAVVLRQLLAKRAELQTAVVEQLTHHPPESLVGFLLSAASAFYLAERESNSDIRTFVDALYYTSTCLTVGYADVFPATQQGRLIASLVMTLGPALTNNALDPPGRATPASAHQQEVISEQLQAILETLKQNSATQ